MHYLGLLIAQLLAFARLSGAKSALARLSAMRFSGGFVEPPHSTLLCGAIGFSSTRARSLRESIFPTNEAIECGIQITECVGELLALEQTSLIAVSYVSKLDALSDNPNLDNMVASYAMIARKRPKVKANLYILLEEGIFSSGEAAGTAIRAALSRAAPGNQWQVHIYIVRDDTDIASQVKGDVWAAIDEARAHSSTTVITPQQLVEARRAALIELLPTKEVSTARPSDARELAAQEAARGMPEALVERLNASLSAFITSGLIAQGATVYNTMTALRAVVQEVIDEHRYQYADVLVQYGNATSVQDALRRTAWGATETLLPIYRTLTQSLVQGSLSTFDRQAARLTPARRLPEQLRILCDAVLRGFTQSADKVREEFERMIAAISQASPLSAQVEPARSKWMVGRLLPRPPVGGQPTVPQLSVGFELQCLREFLRQRSEDTKTAMFLRGEYNPYVRETPLPPIHLNVNYLVDPRAVLAGREVRRLYDEHRDGPCLNRADPMYFPGVAAVPFDPNQHPVSTEKGKHWIDVLKDFFGNK